MRTLIRSTLGLVPKVANYWFRCFFLSLIKAPPPILASKTDALEKRKSVHKEETHEQTPPVQKVEPFTTTSPAEVEKLRKEVSGLREKLEKMEKKFNESLKKQEEKFMREIEVLTNDFDEEKKQNAAELAALKVELNILKRRQSRLNLDDTQWWLADRLC